MLTHCYTSEYFSCSFVLAPANTDAYIVRTTSNPKFDYETNNKYTLEFFAKDASFQSLNYTLKVKNTSE